MIVVHFGEKSLQAINQLTAKRTTTNRKYTKLTRKQTNKLATV